MGEITRRETLKRLTGAGAVWALVSNGLLPASAFAWKPRLEMYPSFPVDMKAILGNHGTVYYFGEETRNLAAIIELAEAPLKMARPSFHDGWFNATEEAANGKGADHPYRMVFNTIVGSDDGERRLAQPLTRGDLEKLLEPLTDNKGTPLAFYVSPFAYTQRYRMTITERGFHLRLLEMRAVGNDVGGY